MSILDPFVQQFNAAVANLDAKVAQLGQTEQDLYDVYPGIVDNPELLQKWQDALDRVIAAQSTVDAAQNTIATVVDWWNAAKSALGISSTPTPGVLSGLGVFPEIPWTALALIAGGAAAIAGVIYGAAAVVRECRLYALQQTNAQRAADGLPPLMDVAPGDQGSGFLSNFGTALPWILGGAILLLALPHVQREHQ